MYEHIKYYLKKCLNVIVLIMWQNVWTEDSSILSEMN